MIMKTTTLQNPFGFCPVCGEPGVSRERRPNGNDICTNNHTYLSVHAVFPPVQPIGTSTLENLIQELDGVSAKLKKHVADMKAVSERNK